MIDAEIESSVGGNAEGGAAAGSWRVNRAGGGARSKLFKEYM